jgi:hypothetical protein
VTPHHTAEEVATFLRNEIQHRNERIADIKIRRERVSDRYEAQRDAASDEVEKARITKRWGEALREKDEEIKIVEAECFAFRRTLQYLTGELW